MATESHWRAAVQPESLLDETNTITVWIVGIPIRCLVFFTNPPPLVYRSAIAVSSIVSFVECLVYNFEVITSRHLVHCSKTPADTNHRGKTHLFAD